MDADRYSISRLVDDLKRIIAESKGERDILAQIRPLARRAALSSAVWLEDSMYQADPDQGFGVHLLHENPDHTLAVFAVSWLPNRGTLPHNHGTWAVVVGVDGPERNKFFQRLDDGKRPRHVELKKTGEKKCCVGDVLSMPDGVIHSVWNETDAVTVSLHIYGRHINHTGRSQFDLEKRTEMPFILKLEN